MLLTSLQQEIKNDDGTALFHGIRTVRVYPYTIIVLCLGLAQVSAIHQSVVPHANDLSRMLNRKQFYQPVVCMYVCVYVGDVDYISRVKDGNLDSSVV